MADKNHTHPTIAGLKDALAETLRIDGHDPAILNKQTAILDRLFTAILDQKVANALNSRYPESTRAWLHFALRVQKQCMDTVKSRSAIEYMDNLTTLKPMATPAPGPQKIEKQTIKDAE